jgi:hypothetical protein
MRNAYRRDLTEAQCFFVVGDEVGATRMGGEPEGNVVGVGFLACFGFLTSRLLRI